VPHPGSPRLRQIPESTSAVPPSRPSVWRSCSNDRLSGTAIAQPGSRLCRNMARDGDRLTLRLVSPTRASTSVGLGA
jgi:hypothetical protein